LIISEALAFVILNKMNRNNKLAHSWSHLQTYKGVQFPVQQDNYVGGAEENQS